MARKKDRKRKCFTLIWNLENASYCWQKGDGEFIESPPFMVDGIMEMKWKLQVKFSNSKTGCYMGLYLQRQEENEDKKNVKLDCELAILSSDGSVLSSYEEKNSVIEKNGRMGTYRFVSLKDVFSARKSVFLPQDTLTIRCRIWKSVGEIDIWKDVQCFARTRITVEKRSILWNIEKFSGLEANLKEGYRIRSLMNGETLMFLELWLTGGLIYDETVRVKITPNYQNIKMSTFKLFLVDSSKSAVECFQDEFWYLDSCESKDFKLPYTKSELLERKEMYLPEDVLSLYCECVFAFGTVQEEIEDAHFDCSAIVKKKSDNRCVYKENEISVPKYISLDNLKPMLNVSDVKLRSKSESYPALSY